MRAVTIKEAKARLNELVEAAITGQEVVIMRGSKHVAAIVPISEGDLQLAPRLSDDQAARLWRALSEEQASGGQRIFSNAADAVSHLEKIRRPSKRSLTSHRR